MAMMLHGHQDEDSRKQIGGYVDPLRMVLIVNCLCSNYLNK